LGKILEFVKTDKIILKEMKRDAIKELNQLYHYTGGFRYPVPPILDDDLMQAYYDGTLEF
jgi:hypothetical protein